MIIPDTKESLWILGFYADDFTGATDAMDALTVNGLPTVLFLRVPEPAWLEDRFKGFRCFGVAGISRSLAPSEMEREIVPVFQQLRDLNVPLIHYKICSTFDSSPEIGSIGKVMDLAADIFHAQRFIPLLVGAPALGRYTVFGNHFAAMNGEVYRLDRHPTMSRHPSTPMSEADLRLHLRRQTNKRVALFDILRLQGESHEVRRSFEALLEERPDAVLFDVLDQKSLERVGEILWEETRKGQLFAIGSSGVEYAIAALESKRGGASSVQLMPSAGEADRILVLSGSCSPVTRQQIETAVAHGFEAIKIEIRHFFGPEAQRERVELIERTESRIKKGKSVIIYSALGPEDDSIAQTNAKLKEYGLDSRDYTKWLGSALGAIAKALIRRNSLNRVVIAGGDTSGYFTKELGVYALGVRAPISPGAPLCVCHSEDPAIDGLELALKGGQLGQADYFLRVKSGG